MQRWCKTCTRGRAAGGLGEGGVGEDGAGFLKLGKGGLVVEDLIGDIGPVFEKTGLDGGHDGAGDPGGDVAVAPMAIAAFQPVVGEMEWPPTKARRPSMTMIFR